MKQRCFLDKLEAKMTAFPTLNYIVHDTKMAKIAVTAWLCDLVNLHSNGRFRAGQISAIRLNAKTEKFLIKKFSESHPAAGVRSSAIPSYPFKPLCFCGLLLCALRYTVVWRCKYLIFRQLRVTHWYSGSYARPLRVYK